MYLVGKVKLIINENSVAWDPIKLCLTRRGAEKRCTTMEYFFIRVGFGDIKQNLAPTFPRRIKE